MHKSVRNLNSQSDMLKRMWEESIQLNDHLCYDNEKWEEETKWWKWQIEGF